MLHNITNPMGYFSNKPLVNNLTSSAQKQRSGLTLPPEAEAYLTKLMGFAETICIGESHPEQAQNVAAALQFIKDSKVSRFQLIEIRSGCGINPSSLIYGCLTSSVPSIRLPLIRDLGVSMSQRGNISSAILSNIVRFSRLRIKLSRNSGILDRVAYVWSTSQQDIKKFRNKNNSLTPAMALAKSFLATITSLGKNV